MKTNQILVSVAVVFRFLADNKKVWLVIEEGGQGKWELPKTNVRKGESSVRAVLRMIGEQAGINARILEEAGRAGSATVVNGETVPKKFLYYVLYNRAGGDEAIGFEKHEWLEYKNAIKKLDSKKEQEMLEKAKEEVEKWLEARKKKKQ